MLNTFLKNLNWRFATKKFNPKKKVKAKNLEQILDAIRLTPSSQWNTTISYYCGD
jgi:nitroreductase/dihydropteridine reductase